MPTSNLTLIISDKPDEERDKVAEIWSTSYGPVLRLGKFWEPPKIKSDSVRVYGAETYSLVLAQLLQIELVTPKDDLIFGVPQDYLKRDIAKLALDEADQINYPAFVKSIVPKQFEAKIYDGYKYLQEACSGLDGSAQLLVSEIVEIVAEARCFVCENQVVTAAIYEGAGELAEGHLFVKSLIDEMTLPQTVVVDIGLLSNGSWCVIEFNASWGSGLNGCSPGGVAQCLKYAVHTKL